MLSSTEGAQEPITDIMRSVRSQTFENRKKVYKGQRIDNQADWYTKKASFNKSRAFSWFVFSVILHGVAVFMLMYRVYDSSISFPVEVIATAP
mgnify:CR=1 FL=1